MTVTNESIVESKLLKSFKAWAFRVSGFKDGSVDVLMVDNKNIIHANDALKDLKKTIKIRIKRYRA